MELANDWDRIKRDGDTTAAELNKILLLLYFWWNIANSKQVIPLKHNGCRNIYMESEYIVNAHVYKTYIYIHLQMCVLILCVVCDFTFIDYDR